MPSTCPLFHKFEPREPAQNVSICGFVCGNRFAATPPQMIRTRTILPKDKNCITRTSARFTLTFSTCSATQRCDPVVFAQVLSTRAPPTFDCLLGTVLPSLLAGISSRNATATSEGKGSEQSGKGPTGRGGRDEAAIFAICRLTASVASAGGEDPVRFRDRVSRSGLRKLGPGGMEAEVALAEAFFYRGAGGAT